MWSSVKAAKRLARLDFLCELVGGLFATIFIRSLGCFP